VPEHLVFMMGNYEARVPTDRGYSRNHLWLRASDAGFRVGFTAYSVRLLQDVFFLDWTIDPHSPVREKQAIGEIESSKALSTLYAPAAGTVLDFNAKLLEDPTPINTDGYEAGWLYEFTTDATPLTPEEYVQVLADGWEETQRHLKGQIN
jgi:glycine cleavage system H protein